VLLGALSSVSEDCERKSSGSKLASGFFSAASGLLSPVPQELLRSSDASSEPSLVVGKLSNSSDDNLGLGKLPPDSKVSRALLKSSPHVSASCESSSEKPMAISCDFLALISSSDSTPHPRGRVLVLGGALFQDRTAPTAVLDDATLGLDMATMRPSVPTLLIKLVSPPKLAIPVHLEVI